MNAADAARGRRTTVLHVVNDLGMGGAQRAMLDQAGALDRTRFEPHVASLELVPRGAFTTPELRGEAPLHLLRAPGEPLPMAAVRLADLIGTLRPSIVHTHLAAAGIAGRALARWRSVPRVVTTLHNASDFVHRRHHPLRILDRCTLGWADRIIAVSDAVHRAFVDAAPGLAARTITIRNGVAIDQLAGAHRHRDASRRSLGLAPETFVVGAVARLHADKGIETLIRAAAAARSRVPRLAVLIVGDGPLRAALESECRSLDLTEVVRFVGVQPHVAPYLAAMDVFAMPSWTEGLGVASIEALAAGVPVLASSVGGLPEVIRDGVCGRLLEPGAPAAWADAIAHYATHRDALAALAQAAPACARPYAMASSVAALEAAYDAVLHGSNDHGAAAAFAEAA